MGDELMDCEDWSEHQAYHGCVQSLLPTDLPCMYCSHPVTHEHGCYEREFYGLGAQRSVWRIHRRFCPACERTFALLPMTVAPYQRVSIVVQDIATALLSGTASHEQVLERLKDLGLSVSESTIRRWYSRVRKQIEQVLTQVSRWVQMERPNMDVPRLRVHVRDQSVLYYYERLTQVAKHSGHVNLQLGHGFMFSPSVSVNRVFGCVAPGYSP